MTRRSILIIALIALACAGVLLLLSGRDDPRELLLGEWKEASTRLYADVEPERVSVRGLARGAITYEWLETEKEPYRLRFTYRHQSYEALVSFSGRDTAIIEPQIWDMLPASARRQLREINRRHQRPEEEFRLLFRRRPDKVKR